MFIDLAEIPTDLGESLTNLSVSPSDVGRDLMNLDKHPATLRANQMTAAVFQRTWNEILPTCARY